ncbi:hypothetical protein FHR81_000746 [Actinoalloteichus hoggarensis]|uniref:Uncharacterized protein n=1 Tax=Actinoalloteichus hoggarensis TaxID=1470176 RepID=A0A221W1C2_9PSEU|nr:hypothetical protein [Actinoalloteichus hoggarensis]ASO19576.1 hypothetical protein AHOG_09660 [Actinoalloteichus hoggarensis]MBB5919717.1 hypothetical protein [Actinoalloteichus hoggarensis]
MPAFEGAPQVLKLLRKLVTRPLFGEVPADQDGRRGIPMLCLARGEDQAELLTALADQLKNATPRRVPHARHSFTAEVDESVDQTELILTALRDLAVQLSTGANTKYGRMRFSRFHLVDWLLRQEFPEPDDIDLRARLSLRSRRRDRLSRAGEPIAEVFDSRWGVLLRTVGALRFAIRLRGRVPGIGNEYRWLLRQPYLAPQDPGTFVGFAERLTRNLNRDEDQGQLQRLIVNAFLEDVRAAHRPFPRFIRAFRRTTYTVLLLDGITPANGGNRLLRLINDVRNDTGAFDPLVVVSGGTVIPPDPAELGAASVDTENRVVETRPAVEAEDAYENWLALFAQGSRRRDHTAWYLPLEVPPPPAEPQPHRRQLDAVRRFSFRAPPWWARRRYTRTGAVLLAAAAAAGAGYLSVESVQTHRACGILPWEPDARTITLTAGECVGVSTNSYIFLRNGGEQVREIEQKIKDLNRGVDQAQENGTTRPVVTVVYPVALETRARGAADTAQDDESLKLDSAHEGLMGIASAQHRLLHDPSSSRPLIRVLVANAGSRMQEGQAIADHVGRLAAEDDSLVGVVGLAQSRKATEQTIVAFAEKGLPIVAATLSAEEMPKASPLYWQVSPDNTREAEVAAAFAANELAGETVPDDARISREVRIISPADHKDLYALDLTKKIATAFRARGFEVEGDAQEGGNPFQYLPDGNPSDAPGDTPAPAELGRASCGYDGLVFFAGRPLDFGEFRRGVDMGCPQAPPTILAGDDISRHAADEEERTRFSRVPFHYLSFAVGSLSCTDSDPTESDSTPSDLYRTMVDLFPQVCQSTTDPSMDGHAALAYDALNLLSRAVDDLRSGDPKLPIEPGMVQNALSRVHSQGAYYGETGRIDFSSDVNSQVPADKFVAVLLADGSDAPILLGSCEGTGDTRDDENDQSTADVSAEWC